MLLSRLGFPRLGFAIVFAIGIVAVALAAYALPRRLAR